MEQTKIINPLEVLKAEIEQKVETATKELKEKKFDLLAATLAELKKSEKDYEKVVVQNISDRLLKEEFPVIAAIKEYSYVTLRHKEVKEENTGLIIGYEVSNTIRQIDLLKLCKYGKLDDTWEYVVSKLNQLFCLRTAENLGLPVAEIAKTYYLKEQAKKIEMGGTPTSNTQLVKALQFVVDAIIFKPGENGKNVYKVVTPHVNYLLMLYAKKGKAALSIATAKDDFLRRLIMDITHEILTGNKFSLEYKTADTKATADKPATATKNTAPTAKTDKTTTAKTDRVTGGKAKKRKAA
jgi:hypothetical protein